MLSPRKLFGCLLGLALLLPASVRAAEPGKYIPPDAEQVIHVNVQQLLKSQLAKKYALPPIEQALKNNKEAQQILPALGLDPLKDVSSITLSNTGESGNKVLVALRGKFDLEKIHKVAESKTDIFKISKVGDKPLYEAGQQGKTVYAGFAEDDALIVSPKRDYVVDALSGKTGKLNKALQEAIAGVDGKQSIWAASVVTDNMKTLAGQRPEAAAVVKKLKAMSGGINVSDILAISLKVQTTDVRAARDLGELANQGKGILQFLAQTNEEFKPFLDGVLKTLEIKTQRTDVSVKFSLSEDLVKVALEKLPKR